MIRNISSNHLLFKYNSFSYFGKSYFINMPFLLKDVVFKNAWGITMLVMLSWLLETYKITYFSKSQRQACHKLLTAIVFRVRVVKISKTRHPLPHYLTCHCKLFHFFNKYVRTKTSRHLCCFTSDAVIPELLPLF